jgi:hypothetical protein
MLIIIISTITMILLYIYIYLKYIHLIDGIENLINLHFENFNQNFHSKH